jgi:long-chain acyl-CoA synthetase
MSNSNGKLNGKPHATTPLPPLEQVFRKRTILLTGATGFLGKVFLYLLLRWHPEIECVYLLIRGDKKSSLNRFRREVLDSPVMAPLREQLGTRFDKFIEERIVIIPGDITIEGLVGDGVDPIKRGTLDAVVHCAGMVNFEASLEKAISVNTLGVANVIDYCKKHDAAMMHVSTCYAAGVADGHRYEDDISENWCPIGKRNFNLQREIREAQATVARIEAESRDQLRQAELADDSDAEPANGDESENGEIHPVADGRRKRWVEERLKEVGKARALSWGWPNTYSYTKSLGEQLVFAERNNLNVTVVRPAVIESALADPFPGWNQGVNTSAPLTYLSGRGYRFYPASAELVLDIIPVDLAAHAMIPILAALLTKRHRPVYQLCTSDVNPLPMRRLVELTALSNRREHRKDGGVMAKIGPHIESVVVSQSTYDLASDTMPRILKYATSFARSVLGEESERTRKLESTVDWIAEDMDLARDMIEVYRPYIQELIYTFHGVNIRELYTALKPADAAHHPFRPDKIDWADYWINVHLPGLRRHIFPQLDLHTKGRPNLLKRHRSLVAMLDSAADRYGSRVALIARQPSGQKSSMTYRELRDGAHRAALLLLGRGVKPGDRVLLIGENSPDWVLAYFAIVCAGAIAVPLDHLISADELAPICSIAQPTAALRSSAVSQRLEDGIALTAPGIIEIDFSELTRPFILKKAVTPPEEPDRKAVASIVFTSGTTGAPKGVMLTHGNFTAEIQMLGRVFALSDDDLVLSLLPLHHTFEFTCGMLLPLASGATIAHPIGVDAKNLSRTLADLRPTALIGVPALWEAIHRRILDEIESHGPFFHAAFNQLRELNQRLIRDSGINLGSIIFRQAHGALGGRLKLAVSGGAALPKRVADFFNDIGMPLLEGYGLTEASPVVSVAHPGETAKAGSVGKPLSKLEVKLDGDGEVGELLVHGPNIMAGYYRNQAATDEVLKDGWLHTGDLGRFDGEGRLFIVGRAKDVIVDAGGNNIYIDEVEEIYGHNSDIKEIAVVGMRLGGGEQPAALVVPAYGRGTSRRTLEDRLRAHFEKISAGLSPHKRVRILRFTDHELPRTRTRKVKRLEVVAILRKMLEARAEEQAAASNAEVEKWLAHAIAQVSNEATHITPATRLIEDLGLDSLALAELAEHIGEHLGRDIATEELGDLRTVDDLQKLAANSNAPSRVAMPSYAKFAEPFTPLLPGPLKSVGRALFRRAQSAVFDSWLKPQILGRGNIPANSNVLVVANHSSHVDFALINHALGEMGKRLVVLAAKDYFFNTPTRRFVVSNLTTLIPFDRERAQLESLDEALSELAAGRSVLMFPEGTRSPDGSMQEFKSGVGYLALRSGCDVLPIHISGTFDVLGKGKLIPKYSPVEMRIGRVVSNAELRVVAESSEGAGAYRKASDFLRKTVEGLVRSGRRDSNRKPRKLSSGAPQETAPREKTSRVRSRAKV